MRIYHGSDHIVSRPAYGQGKPYNDYGRGFYCTESLDLAKEWAVREAISGFASQYDLAIDMLNVLELNSGSYTILHWLTILLQHRTFETRTPLAAEGKRYLIENFNIDLTPYDVIIGCRADDSYFSFAQDFLNGAISLRQLSHAMRLGKLGEQIVLKSPQAFERLTYSGYQIADHHEWYPKKRERDHRARSAYQDMALNRYQKNDIYMTRIIDEGMKAGDVRLQ